MLENCNDKQFEVEESSEYGKMWRKRYRELLEYKTENGNCNVPSRYKKNPPLGHWVMTQRRQYHQLKDKRVSYLTTRRFDRLDQLSFSWVVREQPKTVWDKRFEELLSYYDSHGHCLVPQRYQVNLKLGIWVRIYMCHWI